MSPSGALGKKGEVPGEHEYAQGEIFRWLGVLPTRSWRDRNT